MNLLLPPDIRSRLKADLRRAGTREVGGLLMAEQLPNQVFRVVDYSVDHDAGSFAYFARRPEQHHKRLNRFFASTAHDYERFNYLGEWHSHPSFSIRPSLTDLAAMQALVQEPNIRFAVLLILRLNLRLWLSAHAELFTRDGVRALVSVD